MVEAEVEVKNQSPSKKIKLEQDNSSDDGLNVKIKQQLDYYFSDVNIIKDKFLLGEIEKDDGWVEVSVLLTFSRLQQLTKDENRIVEALQKCKSDVIELDVNKKQIRRKNKLPDVEEYKKELDLRTVHISGFPTDYSFENLRTFSSQFGEVESVAMRRHFKTRFFKGCIHVVFKRVEDAKKVLDTKPLMCKDRELKSESMEQYHKRKAEMAEKRKEHRTKRKGRGDTNDNNNKVADKGREADQPESKDEKEKKEESSEKEEEKESSKEGDDEPEED